MSDVPCTYSSLSAEEQAALSVWIEPFERSYEYEGTAALRKTLKAAPDELRTTLLSQLLPPLIDTERKRHGGTPTLHELRLKFPDQANELTLAYPLLPSSYRLPIELRGYRVLRVAGEGGQAIVLRAQDDVHSAVAIKLSTSPEHNDLVLRERQLLGQCQHSGIPEVIASGVDEDRAFFIMPFLRGMTLADKYATQRPTATEAARIGAELCDIVTHLHEQAILHRDIKPQNVWIDDQQAVKLIDLGMAIERSSWGKERPAVQEFHGTPAFMSPEQAASDGVNDGELSDVFSIGATLYWMGTGSPPFQGDSGKSVLADAADCHYDQDRLQAVAHWPKSLTRVCMEAMVANPADRLASVATFGKQLRSIAEQPTRVRLGKRQKAIAAFLVMLSLAAVVLVLQPGFLPQWLNRSFSPDSDLETRSEVSSAEPTSEAEMTRWIDRVAASQGIDLTAIKQVDFQISVRCFARLIEPWGDQKRSPSASPELAVQVSPELQPLAEALEWRAGNLPWSMLQPSAEETGYSTLLSPLAAGDHGPVEIRLVSDPALRSETAVGPYRFDLNIAQALQDDEQAFGRRLLEEATTEKCFDVAQPGWAIRNEYSRRLTPIIDEFWFGEKRDGEMVSVSAHLKKLAKEEPSASATPASYSLQESFDLVSNEIQSARRLWVKIKFSNGATWGPVLYEKPLTEAQKEKQRVLAWFEQLGHENNLAKFQNSEFLLTRLNEVIPSLTHLHFVGTQMSVNGDPTHVTKSKSGDPKDNKIEEKPSSEVVFDLSRIAGDRTIQLPLVWNPVTVKGRFPDGTFTPSFKIYNSDTTGCHCSILPFDASSREADRELYVYIEDNTYPSVSKSILPFIPNSERLSKKTVEGCKRTRLSLLSPLPAGAVRAEYYSDSKFTEHVESAQPGILYARYVNSDKETVGYSAYKLSNAFMKMWVEHALGHAEGAE